MNDQEKYGNGLRGAGWTPPPELINEATSYVKETSPALWDHLKWREDNQIYDDKESEQFLPLLHKKYADLSNVEIAYLFLGLRNKAIQETNSP